FLASCNLHCSRTQSWRTLGQDEQVTHRPEVGLLGISCAFKPPVLKNVVVASKTPRMVNTSSPSYNTSHMIQAHSRSTVFAIWKLIQAGFIGTILPRLYCAFGSLSLQPTTTSTHNVCL
ncbi:hypothetical protein WG66_016861, partial [Moniliophthora roreri]